MTNQPYNPLEKENLARSIKLQLLESELIPLGNADNIKGAGIYVIYYSGLFVPYAQVRNQKVPIYIGKAIPKGGRKGGLGADASKGSAMADRLGQHASSIDQCDNLDLKDFQIRFLMVDDIWIPLGENMLIEQFKPVWNRAIDGFGNKDPGKRRATQYKSPWDVLHPGRKFAAKLADSALTAEFLEQRIADYFSGKKLQKLPKAIEEQQADEVEAAQEAADEV
jgi:Eco29kI restriction endonuclease